MNIILDEIEVLIIIFETNIGLPFNVLVVSYVVSWLEAHERTYTTFFVKLLIFGKWHDSRARLAFWDNINSLSDSSENLIFFEFIKSPLTDADAPVPTTTIALAQVPKVAVADAHVSAPEPIELNNGADV